MPKANLLPANQTKLLSGRDKAALTVLAVVIYGVVALTLTPILATSSLALVFLPVMVVAVFYGALAGMVASLFGTAANLLLLFLFPFPAIYAGHLQETLITSVILFLAATLVGRVTGLHRQLQRHLNELNEVEVDLEIQRAESELLLENLPTFVVHFDRQLRYRYVNAAFSKWVGIKTEDFIGKKSDEVAIPQALGLTAPYFAKVLEGEKIDFEINLPTPGGQTRTLSAKAIPHFDEKGEVGSLFVFAVDITDNLENYDNLQSELVINAALSKLYKPLISPTATLQGIASTVLAQALSLTQSAHGFVSSIDPISGDNIGHTLTEIPAGLCGVSPDQQDIVLPRNPDGSYPGLWGAALNSRQAFFTNTPHDYPASAGVPEGHIALERLLGVPVLLEDELVGLIALANPERDYTPRDLNAVQRLAEFYALAIQRQRVQESEREQRLLAEALSDVATALTSTLDIDQLLERILTNVGKVLPHDAANIMLIDENSGIVRVARSRGYEKYTPLQGNDPVVGLRINDLPGLKQMAQTCNPLIILDTQQYPNWVSFPVTKWVRSYAGAPICVKGKIAGFLSLDSATPGFFNPRQAPRLIAFAEQAAIAIENARLYSEVQRLAVTDALTGLYNRGFFEAELKRLQGSRQYPISVLLADVDNLKRVNDTYGHAAGDALLKRAAQALRSIARAEDLIARIGGDEFALLLPQTDEVTAQAVVQRLSAEVERSNHKVPDIPLALSVGVSTCSDSCQLQEVLTEADLRMYQKKRLTGQDD